MSKDTNRNGVRGIVVAVVNIADTAAVATTSLTTFPPGILSTNFFGYDGRTYKPADRLEPGWGYFVKVNSDGVIVAHSAGNMAKDTHQTDSHTLNGGR